jgi:hypothetical protein
MQTKDAGKGGIGYRWVERISPIHGTFLYQLRVVDPVNGGTGTFVKTLKMTLVR